MTSAIITNAADAYTYMTSGHGSFTLVSKVTGTRFTYKVQAPEGKRVRFARVLTGPDNQSDFTYIGHFYSDNPDLKKGRKGAVDEKAKSFLALKWALCLLHEGKMPHGLEVWHDGRCCRCGRKLTVPESIASGIGPVCASKV